MVKGRFIVNPFTELALTENDHTQLKELANSLIMTNLEKYTKYQDEKNKGMDPRRWKLCKQRQGIKMYVERQGIGSSGENITGNGLPLIWGIGNKEGKLDDLIEVTSMSSVDVARAQMLASGRIYAGHMHSGMQSSVSSDSVNTGSMISDY
ncbi:hypothetical protein PI125_g18001 [Phytophthora idaei]|nr:hypothetical protein PI125_g18001 [Phytophthora idaei]